MPIDEAFLEEISYVLGQRLPRQRARARLQRDADAACIQEISTAYTFFDMRRLYCARVHAAERVHAFHKKLVYDYGKSESVVIDMSHYIVEILTLNFRRGIFRLPDLAWEYFACLTVRDLERVGVYQRNLLVSRDEGIRLVDVPYDIPRAVQLI